MGVGFLSLELCFQRSKYINWPPILKEAQILKEKIETTNINGLDYSTLNILKNTEGWQILLICPYKLHIEVKVFAIEVY